MPKRKTPLITGNYYHIYNRGINKQATFPNKWGYERAILALKYYRHTELSMRLSIFLNLKNKPEIANKLNIIIIAYCLMPNHFHILAQQKQDNGIIATLSKFQSSYTRAFNVKTDREGPLFMPRFRAKLVKSHKELLHVSRYIHLNPYSSKLVSSLNDLDSYPWSSLSEYTQNKPNVCQIKNFVLNKKEAKKYKEFVFDHANYQKSLEKIKHLTLE